MTFLYKGNYLISIKSVIPNTPPTTGTQRGEDTITALPIAKSPVKKAEDRNRLAEKPSPRSQPPSSPPPPVLPKTARTIARKYEPDFASKKLAIHANGPVTSLPPVNHHTAETPPPVPSSTRPSINKSRSVDDGVDSGKPLRAGRSKTTSTTQAKPMPLSPEEMTTKTISAPTRSLPKKVQSSVLLSALSKYKILFQEHPQTVSTTTAGPNFSFHVS